MVGVLNLDKGASKGIITTTSEFAPGVEKDKDIAELLPTRLELKPRGALLDWLGSVADGPAG